jgi:ATP-dependent RNA helicase SUPV3L1/SUV3
MWRRERGAEAPVGQLRPGPSPLTPRLEVLVADSLSGQVRAAIGQRLGQWLDRHLAKLTMPLRRLQAADLEAPGRGLAFLLVEGLGNVRALTAQSLLATLGRGDRARLTKLGVRFGVRHVYVSTMLEPRALGLRARLWAIQHRLQALPALAPDSVAFPADPTRSKDAAEATGFEALGASCVRIDVVERLAARLRARALSAPFRLDLELLRLTGLREADLVAVVEALGYVRDAEGRFNRRKPGRRRQPRPRERAAAATAFAALGKIRVRQ